MSSNNPPTKKRKIGDGTPLHSLDVRPAWIVPSFSTTDPSKEKKTSVTSLTKPPSFVLNPDFESSFNTPSKPKVASRPLSEFRLPSASTPFRVTTPHASSSSSSVSRGLSLSALNGRFQSPIKPPPPTTPLRRKTIFPPPIAFVSPAPSSTPSSSRTRDSKPLNQTPLTTRLATITAPSARTDSSSDGVDAEDEHQHSRSAISHQAREMIVKTEEQSLLHKLQGVGADETIDKLFVGMTVSPEKPDRAGKRKGLVRNGLAERASQLISRAQNDTSLWSHELSRSLAPASSSSTHHPTPSKAAASKSPPPDLRLAIVSILTSTHLDVNKLRPQLSRPPPLPPAYCLAKCRHLDGDSSDDVLVLLSFSSSGAAGIASSKGLEVGKTVLMWKPWIEVDLSSGHATSSFVGRAILCSRYLVRNAR